MIHFSNIEKQFSSKVLYRKETFSVDPQKRYGIIGPNGAGKTIMFKMITKQDHPDSGVITMPKELSIGYLPQELEISSKSSVIEYMLEPFTALLNMEKTLSLLSKTTDVESVEYKKAMHNYDIQLTNFHAQDLYSLESRAKKILAGLGILAERQLMLLKDHSGGFRMRVALARLLLEAPDLILLDEPTNHLDYETLIWLENFLSRYDGGLMIISHDRNFLNRVINTTLEISNGTVTVYNGSINSFENWKSEQDIVDLRRQKNIGSKIASTERFIERFKSKATKAAQARSRMKSLEKLKKELPIKSKRNRIISFRFPETVRSGSVVFKAENVTIAYGKNVVLDNISLDINRGDHVAVIGPNGAGKSTLLKLLSNILTPITGSIQVGHNVSLRYYSQHRVDQLNPKQTLLNSLLPHLQIKTKHEALSILGAFLFTDEDSDKKVEYLSGGEKSRLSLATLLADPGNVLLLDEPTNHLDLNSIERLGSALSDFKGTIVVVSHDEYFLSKFANRIIELRPKFLRNFPGTLNDYRSAIENGYITSLSESSKVKTTNVKLDKGKRIEQRNRKKQLERLIGKCEKEINNQEKKIAIKDSILHDPSNAQKAKLLSDTQIEKEALEHNAHTLIEEWEKLHLKLKNFH